MVWNSQAQARRLQALLFILLSFSLSSCSKKLVSNIITNASCSSRVSPTYTSKAEAAQCTTSYVPTSTDMLMGQANYEARTTDSMGELTTLSGARPIRFAEVDVTTASGAVVACFETSATGSFGGSVPDDLGALTVKVKSRSNNSTELLASVLNCPEENVPYSVSGTYDPASPASLTISATYTGEVLSAAFNILDQFYEANEFLRSKVGTCSGDCTAVPTTVSRIQAYWVKGFNPNAYFNAASSPVSFYIPGYSRLFILGGIGGDVDTTDTDHFDNSVILHEYGHFLEDIASDTDSPGGSHSGNKIIDPRLAWSEGFGNFIQAAITGSPYYVDSVGNSSGTASNTFNISLETSVGCTNGCDIPTAAGEGNFREFSVARLLWDVFDTTGESGDDDVNDGFIDIWRSMTSSTGLKNPLEGFRSISLLHDYQASELTPSWATLRSAHDHGRTEDYGQYIKPSGSGSCSFSMTPFIDNNELYTVKNHFNNSSQYDAYTNQFDNSDMYYYENSSGNVTLTVASTTTSGLESDLDVYVFNADGDIVSSSYGYFDNKISTAQTQTVNIPNGKYWIRVMVYTGRNNSGSVISDDPGVAGTDSIAKNAWINAGGPLTYTLKIGATDVCRETRIY